MEGKATKRRLLVFAAFTFGIAWVLFLLVPILGFSYGSLPSIILVAAAMFAPTLGNILTRWVTKEGFRNMYLRPHFKGHIRHYLLVFFGPTLLLFLSAAVYFLIVPGSFDPTLTLLTDLAAANGALSMPAEQMLLASALQVIVLGPIINVIPTLGEELGWRGYLLPKLRELHSNRTALLISGAIWGIWHAPVIILGHNYGTEYVGYPWLGILSMVLFCLALGVIEGYVTIKLKSAIPAAMIHSTVNAGAGIAVYLAKPGFNPLLGPAITGVIGGLPFLLLAVFLFVKIGAEVNKATTEIVSMPETDIER